MGLAGGQHEGRLEGNILKSTRRRGITLRHQRLSLRCLTISLFQEAVVSLILQSVFFAPLQNHREILRETLRAIIRQTGISVDEFVLQENALAGIWQEARPAGLARARVGGAAGFRQASAGLRAGAGHKAGKVGGIPVSSFVSLASARGKYILLVNII